MTQLIVITSVLLALTGCRWDNPSTPSVLIVAVESLGFASLPCRTSETADPSQMGSQILCEEAIRFTHAYTPSVMSQAALTSILTARYPMEHGVRHNGDQFLANRFETAAELAVHRHFATSFFSGGPPIWRKSGLNQGFEIFDDNVQVDWHESHRPVMETFKLFLNWLEIEAKGEPFFSVIYVPDLQFPRTPTMDESGNPRELSLESQITAVDSAVRYLIQQLKRDGRWDNTYFVLTGLNGTPIESAKNEIKSTSLHSGNTQVTLFVKPAHKKRDAGINWKIDNSVSLVDLGATLFDILGSGLIAHDTALPAISLKSVLDGADFSANKDRLILSESAWPDWHKFGDVRYALRSGQFLLFYDHPMQVFNTLTDPFEQNPLSDEDARVHEFRRQAIAFFHDRGIHQWSTLNSALLEKFELAGMLWGSNKASPSISNNIQKLAHDLQSNGWIASYLISKKQWPQLLKLAQKIHNHSWEYVAQRNLGHRAFWPADKCLSFVRMRYDLLQQLFAKECDDELLGFLLAWMSAPDEPHRERARERFLREYYAFRMDTELARLNYLNGLSWDMSDENPKEPARADLVLNLPENQKYLDMTRRRLQRFNGLSP